MWSITQLDYCTLCLWFHPISPENDILLQQRCHANLERMLDWLSSNSLYLNNTKTKNIRFDGYQECRDLSLQQSIDNSWIWKNYIYQISMYRDW